MYPPSSQIQPRIETEYERSGFGFRSRRDNINIVRDPFFHIADFDYCKAKVLQETDWWSAVPSNVDRDGWHYTSLEALAQQCFRHTNDSLKQRVKRAIKWLSGQGLIETALLMELPPELRSTMAIDNPRTLCIRSCPAQIEKMWDAVSSDWRKSKSTYANEPSIENDLPSVVFDLPSVENDLPTYISAVLTTSLSSGAGESEKDFSDSDRIDRDRAKANENQPDQKEGRSEKEGNSPARTEIKKNAPKPWRETDEIYSQFVAFIESEWEKNSKGESRSGKGSPWIAKNEMNGGVTHIESYWGNYQAIAPRGDGKALTAADKALLMEMAANGEVFLPVSFDWGKADRFSVVDVADHRGYRRAARLCDLLDR